MSRDNPQPKGYPSEQRDQILAAYQERSSLRGLTRYLRRCTKHCQRLAQRKKTVMSELAEMLFLADEPPILELDELWSFVLKKANK